MSRIRTVKPELFLDEELGALTGDHVLLFIGLWTLADREGRLEDRPARIKASLFPYRSVDVDALLTDLEACGAGPGRHGKVVRYSTPEGLRVVGIPAFVRHQRPHPKEPNSCLPPPPEPQSRDRQRPAVERSASIPSSPVGREGKGREGDLGRERDLRAGAPGSVRGADEWGDVPEADPLDVRQVTPGERLADAFQAAGNGPPSDEEAPPKAKAATRRSNAPEAAREAATAAVCFFGHCAEVCERHGLAWDGPGNAGREGGVRWYNGAIRDLLDAMRRKGEAPDGQKADAQLRAGYAAFAASTDDWIQRNGHPWAAFAKGFAKWAAKPEPVDKWKGKPGWEPPAQTSA